MRRAVKAGLLFASVSTLVACSAIIGTRDLTLVSDEDAGSSDGGGPDATRDATQPPTDGQPPGNDAASDAPIEGSTGDGAACTTGTDFTSDKHNCGRCGHDCLGAACIASMCEAVKIVQGQPGAAMVAVDATNIYWTGNYNNQVLKADKDGKNVTIMADVTTAESAYGIALDDTYVYWTTAAQPGTVARCAKTGCNKLGTSLTSAALDIPRAVALGSNGQVFWAENDVIGGIGRVSPDGGGFGYLVTQEHNLFNLAVDDASVYFVSQVNVGRIARTAPVVDSGEADAAAAFSVIYEGAPLWGSGIALDNVNVYWAENNDPGGIRFAPKAGLGDAGVPTTIAENERLPWHIAVDDTNVYWSATGPDTSQDNTVTLYVDGYVATCPKTGCGNHPPTMLATGLANARGIAVDKDAVYVTYYGNETSQGTVSEGGIVKVAKP